MKVFLMHRDEDFDLQHGQLPNSAELTQDLELNVLFDAMAAGDKYLLEIARGSVLSSLFEPEAILYRQHIVADCLEEPRAARELYGIAVDAIARENNIWGWLSDRYPEATLHRAIEVLRVFVASLHRLRRFADQHDASFHSDGFKRLFAMLRKELSDEYLRTVNEYLQRLEFSDGVLMSAELGTANKGTNYVLRKSQIVQRSWMDRTLSWLSDLAGRANTSYTYEIDDRDEAGSRALSDLRVRGIRHVATALAQSTDHILSFFNTLRLELGFYIGCLNLHDALTRNNAPLSFPEPLAATELDLSCRNLYDACLSLTTAGPVVGNDVNGTGKALLIITGANQGGKSTFLRSLGVAQLMMQCGMFVPAEFYRVNVCRGVFSHFKREEDASMESGKLDEELGRMSTLVDRLTPCCMVLFNESFASTNEREGSEVARQVVRALLECGIKVLYVTHMFNLANGFFRTRGPADLFLRAERLVDGQRTFRLLEGGPLSTSHGEDLFHRIFGGGTGPVCSSGAEMPPDETMHLYSK